MRDAAAYVVAVTSAAVIHGELGGRARVLNQAIEQADAGVLFLEEPMTEPVGERQRPERADRIGEQ